MDLNSDGKTDILSGSYSRSGKKMAGLFYVLSGVDERGFAKAKAIKGSDGAELIIQGKDDVDYICTRPTAVDLNGDGALDIVSGNFRGGFAFFRGKKKDGKLVFEAKSEWLKTASGRKLHVEMHSDPVFVDWDKDGDLDLLSGAANGSVYFFRNDGTAKEPVWNTRERFVKGSGHGGSITSDVECGDAHFKGAQSSARVCVEDMNGDGKLDLLVGDQVVINSPAKGHDEASMRKGLEAWSKAYKVLMKEWGEALKPDGSMDKAKRKDLNGRLQAMYKKRKDFIHEDRTGFVWLYLAK